MNIKRIRLTRFEQEDNFDFSLIRGVNQLLFTSITDQQCRMSFNRPFAPLPTPPSYSPLFCTPPHPTTLFTTVLYLSNTPTILFRQISVPRVNSVRTGQVLCAESAQKILTRTNLERPHVKTVSMGPRLCNWLRLLQRHVAVRN